MMKSGMTRKTWQAIAAMVFLCSLLLSVTYISFRGLSKLVKKDEDVNEPVTLELMRGSILFNGKRLDFQTDPPAAGNGLLAALTQAAHKVEDEEAEAAWRRLNSSLYCGPNDFRFKAMGPDAADLKLDLGHKEHVPLTQVPKACGFSVKQTALGLVLHVPFDGCSVKKGNGTYVLTMSWKENTVKLTCAVLGNADETPATSESLLQPPESASSYEPQSLVRSKRHGMFQFPPLPACSPSFPYPWCTPTSPPQTTTTTAEPTLIPSELWNTFKDVIPVYEQYIKSHPYMLIHNFHTRNHPAWNLFRKPTEKPNAYNPFQHFWERHFHFTTTNPPTTTVQTTTPCAKTTTASWHDCRSQGWFIPYPKIPYNYNIFRPRVSFNDGQNNLPFMTDEDYRMRSQVPQDPLWESFPLLD